MIFICWNKLCLCFLCSKFPNKYALVWQELLPHRKINIRNIPENYKYRKFTNHWIHKEKLIKYRRITFICSKIIGMSLQNQRFRFFFNKAGGKSNVTSYSENFIYGGANSRYHHVTRCHCERKDPGNEWRNFIKKYFYNYALS